MFYDTRWDEAQVEAKPLKQWQKTLLEAADYIEANGWLQGSMGGPEGPVCAWGAMFHRGEDSLLGVGQFFYANHKFKRYLGQRVPHWNDAHGRTKEQVVHALRDCARS